MKISNLVLLLIVFSLIGCKTKKIMPKPVLVAQTATPSLPPASATTEKVTKPANISSKEERFSVASGETADYGSDKFFVILGSFSVSENAKHLKTTLTAEGFHPVILINESGMYRVCGNSYPDEAAARARITEVRTKFTKYSDIWLLIKKQ